MSAATPAPAGVPKWVLLEPVVFRRDDESFPDESEAPVRATGTTSWGADFQVAFSLADPPLISRLYVHVPTFPEDEFPVAMVATHRQLALFRVGTMMRSLVLVQDFFVYNAASDDPASSLVALPPCTEPDMDYSRRDGSLPLPRPASAVPRLLTVRSMGLLCRGGEEQEEDFAVAELQVYKHSESKAFADIYLFLKSAGKWESIRLPILHGGDDSGDAWQLCLWQTDTVVPVGDRWLCWVDYDRGILFYDVFGATVSFLRLPLDKFIDDDCRSPACWWLYRGVSAIDYGRALKFVEVARDDGIGYAALKPGASFTITCHTLTLGTMVWSKDWTTTSDELWSANSPDRLPRNILLFPQLNLDRPHVVHFLISDYEYVMKKTWLVAIDMSTRAVVSFSQYTNGWDEVVGSEGAYLTEDRSDCPRPFLPCEFPKYVPPFRFRRSKVLQEGEGYGMTPINIRWFYKLGRALGINLSSKLEELFHAVWPRNEGSA
ncbi:unnamed protein product [Urochloa humidicola]